MNYGHVIDTQRQFIFQVFSGAFSTAQIIACTQRLWNDPAYSKTYSGIADISLMTPSSGSGDLRAVINFLQSDHHTSEGRWAVITSSPLAAASSMVYKKAMAGRHVLEVFSTWECASGFLQLDLPQPPVAAFLTDLNAGAAARVI
jgi:hypothetical protein